MAYWRSIGYALIAFGEMNFCMRLKGKMEKHYENVKEQIIRRYQPEASTPLPYKSELSQEEKDNILKDIYSSIKLFYTIVCEAKKKSFKR